MPPTRQGPCSDSAREGSTPGAIAKTSGGCYPPVRQKNRSKTPKKTWASAGQSHWARRRWGNVMNSVRRGRRAVLMSGGGVCQPGLACANGVADGRKSLFRGIFSPVHRRRLLPSGSSSRRPMPPHGVPHTGFKGLASAKRLVPVLKRCCFMVGFCENLAKVPARTTSSRTRSQVACVVEFTHTSTNALVRALDWRGHNELFGAAVLEKASLLRHHTLLRAGIRHVVHDKR